MKSITVWAPQQAAIAAIGLICLGAAGAGCGPPAADPAAPPALRPLAARTPPAESVPSPAASPALVVWEPASGSLVTTPVRIEGQAAQASGAVSAIVRDDQGKVIGRGSTSLTAGEPVPREFSFEVSFSAVPGKGPASVEVFTLNSDDGSVNQRTQILVRSSR